MRTSVGELLEWLFELKKEKVEELSSGNVNSLERLAKLNTELKLIKAVMEKCENKG